MKRIQLTQGQFAIVDDDDYERLASFKWYAAWAHHTRSFYAVRHSTSVNGGSRTILMHREVVSAPDGSLVDHINHCTLDNRHSNLRICSCAENTRNRRKRRDGVSSSFKGVTRRTDSNKWQARICIGGKNQSLGSFTSELEAALAYNAAARELHGEFALTNKEPRQ